MLFANVTICANTRSQDVITDTFFIDCNGQDFPLLHAIRTSEDAYRAKYGQFSLIFWSSEIDWVQESN